MHRILLGVVIGVVVLAVGAIVVVAVNNKDKDADSQTQSAVKPDTKVAAKNTDPTDENDAEIPVIPVPRRRTRSEPRMADASRTDNAAVGSDEARERMAKLYESLSDEDRSVLKREIRRQDMAAARERQKYSLPTDNKLWRLDRMNDGALKLNESQRAQVDTLKATFKPQMEAAMQNVWTREAELWTTVREMRESGTSREDMGPIMEQFGTLREESNKIKAELDAQYTESLANILNEEQVAALAEMPASSNRGGGRRGGRDRGGNRGGGGGNP